MSTFALSMRMRSTNRTPPRTLMNPFGSTNSQPAISASHAPLIEVPPALETPRFFSRHARGDRPRESGIPLHQALCISDREAIYWITVGTCCLTLDAVLCGGDFGLLPGQQRRILTCP